MIAKALVLERRQVLSLRDIELSHELGDSDVEIAIHTVGICGSDVHYYQHGKIGPFVVTAPMVLGHEASGVVRAIGRNVTHLRPGDRVCMEPGIPDPASRASRLGYYNLDPAVRFWATPPVHGCLTPRVIHPASFTFKLPDSVSFGEAAMVEPFAVGLHAATKAAISPGEVAVVIGAGTIGMTTAAAALAAGCSQVIISDIQAAKLAIAAGLGPVRPVDVTKESLRDVVMASTDQWGADVIFEASGSPRAFDGIFDLLRPAGRVVLIGMPGAPAPVDVVSAQVKEASVLTIFRYAHVFDKAVALLGAGKVNLKPLITETFSFKDSVAAFEFASALPATSVKVQITLDPSP